MFRSVLLTDRRLVSLFAIFWALEQQQILFVWTDLETVFMWNQLMFIYWIDYKDVKDNSLKMIYQSLEMLHFYWKHSMDLFELSWYPLLYSLH